MLLLPIIYVFPAVSVILCEPLAVVSSKVSFIQMLGLGSGLAIVLDATLVRGLLVPGLMVIMGRANWWAPRPMKALYARVRLSDGEGEAPAHTGRAGALHPALPGARVPVPTAD